MQQALHQLLIQLLITVHAMIQQTLRHQEQAVRVAVLHPTLKNVTVMIAIVVAVDLVQVAALVHRHRRPLLVAAQLRKVLHYLMLFTRKRTQNQAPQAVLRPVLVRLPLHRLRPLHRQVMDVAVERRNCLMIFLIKRALHPQVVEAAVPLRQVVQAVLAAAKAQMAVDAIRLKIINCLMIFMLKQ